MADKSIIEQMLERLVNEDQAKAEELFHEYVVSKSREIYESLIESEIAEETEEDEEDEDVEESSEQDEDEESVEENFEEFDVLEADPTDDLETDVEVDGEEADDEMGGDEDQSEEEVMQDIESIIDELQAKFDELKGEEEEQGEFGDEEGEENPFGGEEEGEEEVEDSFDQELATVREYVEKITGGHGAEKKGAGESNVNAKSIVAGKNDMGGTAGNIAQTGTEKGAVEANKGQLKGNGVFKGGKPTEDNAGNVNVPGGNVGKTGFKTKEPGHGAEKAGAKETADNKQSLFRK